MKRPGPTWGDAPIVGHIVGQGGLPSRPLNAPTVPGNIVGVQPGTSTGTFIGHLVVVYGSGPTVSGLFVYSGTPAAGNPPLLSITNSTTDPFTNTVTPSLTLSGLPFLVYSGPPANGNLVVSISGAAGSDEFGNSYPAGLFVDQAFITAIAITSQSLTLNPGPLLLYGNPSTTVTTLTAASGNFSVPAAVTSILVECFGPGSGGVGGGNAGGPGSGGFGGAGGAYASSVLTVTPLASLPYSIGTGGAGGNPNSNGSSGSGATSFNSGAVLADYARVAGNGVSTPGKASNSTGTTTNTGGNGGTATGSGGGGGGGSAGGGGAGSSGGGTGGPGAGAGGAGGPAGMGLQGGATGGVGGVSNASGGGGFSPGAGGGGGGGGGSGHGGAGANGLIRLTYTPSGVSQLVASLASTAGTDPNTGDTYPGPGLGLALQPVVPSANSLFGLLYGSGFGTPAAVLPSGWQGELSTQPPGEVAQHNFSTTGMVTITQAWSIPAGDAQVGTVYKMTVRGNGTMSNPASAFAMQGLIGGVAAAEATIPANIAAAGAVFGFKAVLEITCYTTGTSGTAGVSLHIVAGGANTTASSAYGWSITIAFNTTVANSAQLEAQWVTTAGVGANRDNSFERTGT